jgi:hypothetical protein
MAKARSKRYILDMPRNTNLVTNKCKQGCGHYSFLLERKNSTAVFYEWCSNPLGCEVTKSATG